MGRDYKLKHASDQVLVYRSKIDLNGNCTTIFLIPSCPICMGC